jgi:dTDP-D-glucose 4,6-dehydratase
VHAVVPGSRIRYADDASPDRRTYRVDFTKIATRLPEFQPQWTLQRGIEQLYKAYSKHGLTVDRFLSSRYLRIKHICELQARGVLDTALRWRT